MGMFDYIDVDLAIPLPFSLPPGARRELQTKSLACEMNRYRIAADGQLHVLRLVDTGWCAVLSDVPIDEAPEDEVEEERPVLGFTGVVEMHARADTADDVHEYVECSALFVNGKLDGPISAAGVDQLTRVIAERDEAIKKLTDASGVRIYIAASWIEDTFHAFSDEQIVEKMAALRDDLNRIGMMAITDEVMLRWQDAATRIVMLEGAILNTADVLGLDRAKALADWKNLHRYAEGALTGSRAKDLGLQLTAASERAEKAEAERDAAIKRADESKVILDGPVGNNLHGHAAWCYRIEYHPTAPCCCGVGDAEGDDDE